MTQQTEIQPTDTITKITLTDGRIVNYEDMLPIDQAAIDVINASRAAIAEHEQQVALEIKRIETAFRLLQVAAESNYPAPDTPEDIDFVEVQQDDSRNDVPSDVEPV